MRRKDLISTTMALALAVLVAGTLTACNTDEQSSVEVVTTESQVETEVLGYTDVVVEKEYGAMLLEDKALSESPDSEVEVVGLTKGTYITIFATVQFNGVDVDFYHVRTDDNTVGYIEGRYLDFNVTTLEDYADSIKETPNGDGEDTSEVDAVDTVATVTSPTTSEEAPDTGLASQEVIEDCVPTVRYTNTSVNIRSGASKGSGLLDSVSINTEVTQTGLTASGWSRVEYNGMQAFIKSSLLSDSKTEVKQTSSNNGSNGASTDNGGTSSSQPQTPPSGGGAAYGDPFPDGPKAGDIPGGGTSEGSGLPNLAMSFS